MESISSDSYSRSKHKKSKSSHKSPRNSPSHHEKYSHRSRNRSHSRSYTESSHSFSERDDEDSDTELAPRRRDVVRSSRHESARSRSVSTHSDTDEDHGSESDRSYYSRSLSRSPSSNKQSSHRKKNRTSSPHSGSKRSRSHERHHSRSPPRENKRRRHAREERDPRDKSSRQVWDNEVLQIGCWMKDTIFHFCDTCDRPIFVYGRLIPCKHVYCLNCAGSHKEKCARCNEKVMRVERAELGSIHMCFQGGSTHSKSGCRRTYLSQRDLEAHMSHRHKTAPHRSSTSSNATSIGLTQTMQISDQSAVHTVMAGSAQPQNQMTTVTPSSAATGPPPGVSAFPMHRPPPYTVPPNAFARPPPPANSQPPNFSRPPPPANQFAPVQHHMPHQAQPWPQPRPQY